MSESDCASTSRSAWGLSGGGNAPEWHKDALCAQVGGDLWHLPKGGDATPAKQVCAGCPAAIPCLEYAIVNDERWGVWGGFTETERRRLKRGENVPYWEPPAERARPSKPLIKCAACGTGFRGHGCARYCSNKCRPGKGPVQTLCGHCATEFTGDRRTRFCSKVCRGKAYRLKTRSAA